MAMFMWVYAFLSPVGGFVADKFSRRWMVIGSLFVWSAVTYLTGHARTYHEMLVYRGLMGISEAFYMPAALALLPIIIPAPDPCPCRGNSPDRRLRGHGPGRHRRVHRPDQFLAELLHLVGAWSAFLRRHADIGIARRHNRSRRRSHDGQTSER